MSWHLAGMTFRQYLALTLHERFCLHTELTQIIQDTEPEEEGDGGGGGGAATRRQMRR